MEFFLPENVKKIIGTLESSGYEAYAVGGCVRDAVLGKTPKDYDIATSALPEQVKECFGNFKIAEIGIKHGTVTVFTDGGSVEVTTYRTDGNYADRRRPDSVSFSSKIEDDLARRDFTVNAMAYNPRKGLADLYGGKEDLRRRKISCVGNPSERFGEDALRIMRALRFASELDFEIESDTAEAVLNMKNLLNEISKERISRELVLLLCGSSPFKVLTEFAEVFAVIIPQIKPCIGFSQHSRYHIYDVWTHIAAAVERSEPHPDVRLALMLHDIGKPLCFKADEDGNGHFFNHPKISAELSEIILRGLHFSNETVKRVSTLIKYHYVTPVDDFKVVRRLLSVLGEENFFLLTEVMKGDNRAKQNFCTERIKTIDAMREKAGEIIAENRCFKLSDLDADGSDMIKLGFSGREIGIILKRLLDAVIDEEIPNEKKALLDFARSGLR